ncbi:probable pectinesterase/pectinesterase inhibitor 20 [Nymphaea colorata]|nr:probable pectinesterase/pectinesterase inhibitor 20 [Nymphaea colorata]
MARSLIPSQSRSNLYGYGRYLAEKSLHQSATFSSLIDGTIRDNASLPSQAAGALADCFLLSQLTTDFLLSSLATLESNNTTPTCPTIRPTTSRSWATQKAKRERQLLDELRVRRDGGAPWVNEQALEFASGRRMALQTVGSVVVAQDGSGNYLTIGHAIAAAPAKNDGSKGFFLIRVKAGVYNEYVTLDKKKKYVMMVGGA